MRKTLAITLMLLVVIVQTAGAITASNIKWGQDVTSSMASNTLKQWTQSIENRLGGLATAGTGSTFYVDSNVSIEGDGSSWTNARNTLQEAVDLCTADNGDVIYVAQGTAETIASAGALALDCAGITIIGCGTGDQRPTYTASTAATADITVTADDVYVYNMIFQSGKADLATVILVTADDFTLDHCTFRDSTSGFGMITIGAADNDSDRFCIANSFFYQPGTTNDHSIEILFDMVGGVIANNIFYGDYDEGAIAVPAGGNACLDLSIVGNLITNVQASGKGISINGTTSTGIIAGNSIYADTYANGIDPGALMDGGGNYISTAADLAGITALPAPAIGTVTAGSAEDILKKLYYTSDGTGAYPATAANDSTISKIIAKGSTATASTYDNQTDSLEMISDKVGAYTGDGGTDDNDSVKADLDLVQTSVAKIPLSDGTNSWNATALAAIQSEVGDAIDANNLDHLMGQATADTSDPVDIAEVVDNSVLSHVLTDDGDVSDFDRRLSSLERISMWQQVQMAYGNATPGYAHPTAYWFVDGNISVSGDGKTPFTAFKTIDEAITASSNSVEDFIIVWDYSGSAGTITINKSWVHLIGHNGSTHPYPRIAATTGHGITLSNGAGRIEICGFTIGAQATKAGIGLDTGSASQVHVHNCHFGIDASSACQEGINIANGADAVDLVVENCEFKTAITQEGIEIAGNATWGRIRNNLFIGCTASDAYPAINLSGSVVGIAVEGNRIGGGTDDAAGWGISLSATSSECWIDGNHVNDGKVAVGFNPFEDGAANAWGLNYADIVATLP